MSDRYSTLVDRCLEDEDKSHRDQVLAELEPQQRRIVRGMMDRIGKRLAGYVAQGWDRAERNRRLDAINELWLRERVRAMVVERFEQERAAG